MECIHFPDGGGGGVCSICKNGVSIDKARRPDNWHVQPATGYRVDEMDILLEGALAGTMCLRCMTSRDPIGCKCDRERVFKDDLRRAAAFLHDAPSEAIGRDIAFTDTEAMHVALSTFKRASRRVEWESDEERRDVRQGLAEEFGVEPLKTNWYPPRNTEPTPLPV